MATRPNPQRNYDPWPLRLLLAGQTLALLGVVGGTLVLGEHTPTGFFAIATAIIAGACPRCIAANTAAARRRNTARSGDTPHAHQ